MKISTNQPIIFRVNDHTLAFDGGAPLEVSQKDYEVLAKDALFKQYQKDGIITVQQSKPPDALPSEEEVETPVKTSSLKPKA